jgi:hypothetical protein
VWYTSKHCPIHCPSSHFWQYIVVDLFTIFAVWCLLLSTHMRHERQDFPSSLACIAGILYKKWSLPTSLPAGLLVWPMTWISIPALASNPLRSLFYRKYATTYFPCLFWCARCVLWQLPGWINERKVSSAILLPFLLTNNIVASGLICLHQFYVFQHCSCFYYTMCPPL